MQGAIGHGQNKEITMPEAQRLRDRDTQKERSKGPRVRGTEGHTEKDLREVCSPSPRPRERPWAAPPLAGQLAHCWPQEGAETCHAHLEAVRAPQECRRGEARQEPRLAEEAVDFTEA